MKHVLLIAVAMHVAVGRAQWVQLGGGLPSAIYYSVATDGSNIYAGHNGGNPRLLRSTNNGDTWVGVTDVSGTGIVWALSNLNGSLFAGTFGSGAYRSTNGGTSWHLADTGMTQNNPRGFARNSTYVFACSWSGTVYRSSDNGSHWTSASTGVTGGGLWPLLAVGSYVYVGAQSGGVFRSTNNGASWGPANTGLTTTTTYALASVGSDLFAGTDGAGVFKSTNNGNNWSPASTGMTSATLYALLTVDTILVAGTANTGVFVSTNRGASWTTLNDGLTNTQVFSLAVNGQYLYAGTSSAVFRRPLSQLVVGVPLANDLPVRFSLGQNYPNPFNPSTTISFQIPDRGHVRVAVYDLLGREVSTIVNEVRDPGRHSVAWNASAFASGVYFYRLHAGGYMATRKMILVR